jgi:hypothetical protein
MLLGSKYLSLLVLSWLITFQLIGVNGVIDPITGSLVIGSVIAGYFFKDNIPFFSKCPKTFDLQGKFILKVIHYCFIFKFQIHF